MAVEKFILGEPENENHLKRLIGLLGPVSVGIDSKDLDKYKEGKYI